MVLDAGEDTGTRYGPAICFINLGISLEREKHKS
jgi:hypothetical protein